MRDWLREARETKELTMKDMAERLDMTESYYCCIENGTRKKDLSLSLMLSLSRALNLPITMIIKNETEGADNDGQ